MNTKETIVKEDIDTEPAVKRTLTQKAFGAMAAIGVCAIAQVATVKPASAAINESTFVPITNLIDAVIPLFTSILDLIIAVFPLVIAMAFLTGLALLINKIFDKSLNFGKRK